MMTLQKMGNELKRQGWKLDRVSKNRNTGRQSSLYFTKNNKRVRVSDHELGYTVYGERQYGRQDAEIIIQPGLSLIDHVHALNNEDYNNGTDGFSQGYSYDEWLADQ